MADTQSSPASKEFTPDEVAQHSKDGDLWIIIDGAVYDLTKFAKFHPGGLAALLDPNVAGQDATDVFFGLHRHEVLLKPAYARLKIGTIKGETQAIIARQTGALKTVPYAEPTWLCDKYHSPYFSDSHRALQQAMRAVVDETIYPDAQACEDSGKYPSQKVNDRLAELNIHAMRFGPGPHLKGLTLMGGIVKPEEFDYFHEMVITQEIVLCGARGYGDGLGGGNVIGLPPVLNFGSAALKQAVVPDVFAGKKNICLAISEAFAGSDVSNLRCEAKKTEDGTHWIINGHKKWITGGAFADYFTVGCKTDGGLTVILVPRQEGVKTTQMTTRYSKAAGTAYITFDNVRVPVENTLGEEDNGLWVILSNFGHERWVMCCSSARSSRMAVEECIVWANQRKVFGKPLIAQPVIRQKLAGMIAKVEACQSWLESITFNMNRMTYKEQAKHLAGQISLLKMFCTRCAGEIADDAVQIFGGRALTRTGMGKFIESFARTQKFDAILGGAEEVLGDLGVRQAMRSMPENARL